MGKCDYCGSTILLGGKRDANGRFCNEKCRARGALLAQSRQLPEAAVREQVWKVQQGPCPKCGGAGPVDVYTAHQVWSALVLTRWTSTPQLSCAPCGRKAQLQGVGASLLLGWWGFPWGLLLTPIQIGRNLVALARTKPATAPSPQLERLVRMRMAATASQSRAQAAKAGS
jgi:hypothetical protein